MHLMKSNSLQSSLSNSRSCLQVYKSLIYLYTCIYKLVWSYAHIIFLAGFAGQRILGKDCKVRLDRTRPPPKEFLQVLKKHVFDQH